MDDKFFLARAVSDSRKSHKKKLLFFTPFIICALLAMGMLAYRQKIGGRSNEENVLLGSSSRQDEYTAEPEISESTGETVTPSNNSSQTVDSNSYANQAQIDSALRSKARKQFIYSFNDINSKASEVKSLLRQESYESEDQFKRDISSASSKMIGLGGSAASISPYGSDPSVMAQQSNVVSLLKSYISKLQEASNHYDSWAVNSDPSQKQLGKAAHDQSTFLGLTYMQALIGLPI